MQVTCEMTIRVRPTCSEALLGLTKIVTSGDLCREVRQNVAVRVSSMQHPCFIRATSRRGSRGSGADLGTRTSDQWEPVLASSSSAVVVVRDALRKYARADLPLFR